MVCYFWIRGKKSCTVNRGTVYRRFTVLETANPCISFGDGNNKKNQDSNEKSIFYINLTILPWCFHRRDNVSHNSHSIKGSQTSVLFECSKVSRCNLMGFLGHQTFTLNCRFFLSVKLKTRNDFHQQKSCSFKIYFKHKGISKGNSLWLWCNNWPLTHVIYQGETPQIKDQKAEGSYNQNLFSQ
jgi:hypothetical protein